jgi:outer membrane biosynthesis protein TonB
MLGTPHDRTKPIVCDGLLCLRAVVLALLASLVLAASASADEVQGPAGGVIPTGAQETTAAGVGAVTETPPAGEGAGGEAQGPPGETGPVGEPPAEPAPVVPAPEELKEPAPAPPTEPVPTEPAPVLPAAEGTTEVPPIITESVSVASHGEEAPEGSLSSPSATPPPPDAQGATAHNEAAQQPTALSISPAGATPAGGRELEILSSSETGVASSEAGVASVGARARLIAARRIGELSCQLSALGGPPAGNCTSGLPVAARLLSTSPTGNIAVVSLAAVARADPPSGGGHGGSAVGNAPVTPAPGPAPGGASGSGAGASGLALSTFLTLAGLLLLGAPRAMRRLRLSCQPWLTACFVLIPERPG